MPHREQSSALFHQQGQKQWQRKIEARLLLIEAGFCLIAARILLALLSFPNVMRLLSRPPRQTEVSRATRLQKHKDVRRAIYAMPGWLGRQSTCLHRAIAAQVMLRQRGISTTLYFGVARLTTQGLSTHAWLQDGEEGIIGYLTAQKDRYHVVATYPAEE